MDIDGGVFCISDIEEVVVMSRAIDDLSEILAEVDQAVSAKALTESAAVNLRSWLVEDRYAPYAAQVAEHIRDGRWSILDDVFWTVIPFGTGGRRGKMYPIGTNAINDRTIGESAQGLADYIRSQFPTQALSCAIAYDSRHRSRDFAELCASVMVASGFHVFFLDDYRSTPQLSFLIRHRQCQCGIMVTASHNPPSDNAVKIYWGTGGQVLAPHDQKIINCVTKVNDIAGISFDQAVTDGQVTLCTDETDDAYQRAVLSRQHTGPRDIKVLYSPLHGVGRYSVMPVLEQAGFDQVHLYAPQANPDGDFPLVPNNVANPESPAVFEVMEEHANEIGADIIIATDPDADRMGCSARITTDPDAPWMPFNGNQLGAMLADYALSQQQDLTNQHYVIKTLVTTELIRHIADHYGVRTIGDLLVGFKHIAGAIEDEGEECFIYGTEESHGFMYGGYVRDKDGAVACLLISELAAQCKATGKTLHDYLDDLHCRHGVHAERLMTIAMPGSQGMQRMQRLMERLRTDPPRTLAQIEVLGCRDYLLGEFRANSGEIKPLSGPQGNLLVFDLAQEGNYVAVRPSGTEPKVKCYMFAFERCDSKDHLTDTRKLAAERLENVERQMQALADQI